MSASNFASIINLNIEMFNEEQILYEYSESINRQGLLEEKIHEAHIDLEYYNSTNNNKIYNGLIRSLVKREKETSEAWKILVDCSKKNMTKHEEFYDEKFKENTKRQKGKQQQVKYLEKKMFRMNISWEKEDVQDGISKSKRLNKIDWLPLHKQRRTNNRKGSTRFNISKKLIQTSLA